MRMMLRHVPILCSKLCSSQSSVLHLASRASLSSALSNARLLRLRSLLRLCLASLLSRASMIHVHVQIEVKRTYVRPRTYTFVWPHMCGHEQHPQTRSGSPHNACISLVIVRRRKLRDLEGLGPLVVSSLRSDTTAQGPRPSLKSHSFHWTRPSNYFTL